MRQRVSAEAIRLLEVLDKGAIPEEVKRATDALRAALAANAAER